ncbi:MAG: hypothetical protein QMC07_10430 [Flavobacteriaceae bacterium]|jgi:hypothetical protein|tara:strand:- start:6 stop:440 length:435 start_codon:yes stop_codon:yes gene_type:complete
MKRSEKLHKELDLIQNVINRIANNSFLLKGWLVSLIVVILALTKETIVATDLNYFSFLLILPVIIFWYLDAFFLHKEKCYRELYQWVIENRKNTLEYLYSLDYSRFLKKVKPIWKIMFSVTLFCFYGILILILIIVTIYNNLIV